MVGLDIESLYPSIPLEYTLDLAANILKQNEFKNMNKENIIKLLRFCTSDVNFTFNSKFYKQKSGVSMGSPLALVLSDIFLSHLEKTKIFPAMEQNGIFKYFRYVDDIFLLVNQNRDIRNLIVWFNNLHENYLLFI